MHLCKYVACSSSLRTQNAMIDMTRLFVIHRKKVYFNELWPKFGKPPESIMVNNMSCQLWACAQLNYIKINNASFWCSLHNLIFLSRTSNDMACINWYAQTHTSHVWLVKKINFFALLSAFCAFAFSIPLLSAFLFSFPLHFPLSF